ncbi:MAG: hypothetical protein JST40_14100 [Armatimonadetes bacterium]|nr:hypothetical protein [Armatimonadota bacterium]
MTSRERIRSAINGESIDRKPAVVWSASPGHRCDVVISALDTLEQAIETHPDQVVIVEIYGPFGRSTRRGVNLTKILSGDPSAGGEALKRVKDEVRGDITEALQRGAHGVFYRLDGAYPSANTPMEYGGHYLEMDRELLEAAADADFNLIYVEGEEDIYLDFVADLPAHAITWSSRHVEIPVRSARAMARGLVALDNPEADIFFARSQDEIDRLLSRSEAAPG